MNSNLKKIIGTLHLLLGLTTGAVVFLVSLTGTIYVFEEEINLLLQSGVYKSIDVQSKPLISPSELKRSITTQLDFPIKTMNATVYPNSNRANVVWVRNDKREYTGIAQNPYNGQIIHKFSYGISFWAIILGIHTSLLIPEIGEHIVSISTIIFVGMLISGIYLWFPKRNTLKRSFSIKFSSNVKRTNYDVHNVLGFYGSVFALFIAITGLVMSYSWMQQSVFFISSGFELKLPEKAVKKVIVVDKNDESKLETTLRKILDSYGNNIKQYFIEYPKDSISELKLTVNTNDGFWINKKDEYFINPYSGELIYENLYNDKNSGEKVLDANLNIHTGSVLGIAGKILAFFVGIIATSLPITGFYIWWGRKKKRLIAKN